MWLLPAWVLLSAVGAGSAQLVFREADVVERSDCNITVILPCIVVNLRENNTGLMFVAWRKQNKLIFSYNGRKRLIFRDPRFRSANLVSLPNLPKGIASLRLSNTEATMGNYTCEVTELNREGETRFELKDHPGSWFTVMERAIISALLFLVTTLFVVQLCVVVFKYEAVPLKKAGIIVAVATCIVVAVAGTVLFVQYGYTVRNQAGFGLVIVPAVIMIPLQYVMFGIVFGSLPRATFVLIVFLILGYVTALVGFAMSVSDCPPTHESIVYAGLAVMAAANLVNLVFVLIMGCRMKDHPRPGKAVEEPLNELQSNVIREKYTVVDTPWP